MINCNVDIVLRKSYEQGGVDPEGSLRGKQSKVQDACNHGQKSGTWKVN